MRGLSKPWPPRDMSPDGQAPRRFVDAEREYLTTLLDRPDRTRFARTEFDRLDKGKLRPRPTTASTSILSTRPIGSPSAAARRRCASGSRPSKNPGSSPPPRGRMSSTGWRASALRPPPRSPATRSRAPPPARWPSATWLRSIACCTGRSSSPAPCRTPCFMIFTGRPRTCRGRRKPNDRSSGGSAKTSSAARRWRG